MLKMRLKNSAGRSNRLLRHVDEHVDVVFVSPHVLVLDQPLDLLLDHLLRGQEHVLEDVDQLGLQLRVRNLLPHLHNLYDRFLRSQDPQLDDALVLLLASLLRRKLQPTDQVELAAFLELAVLDDPEIVIDPELGRLGELLRLPHQGVVQQDLALQLGEGDEAPEGSPQLILGKFSGESQVFEGEAVVRPILPTEEDGHLEGGDVDVVGADGVGECDGAVRHVVVPLQLASGVFGLKHKNNVLRQILSPKPSVDGQLRMIHGCVLYSLRMGCE